MIITPYVITLLKRQDKFKKFLSGIYPELINNLTKFPAVNTSNIESTNFEKRGALGCLLSHRSIITTSLMLNQVVDNHELNYPLVFEDDAEINGIDFNKFKLYLDYKNIPPDWDVLSFGYELISLQYSDYNDYYIKYKNGCVYCTHAILYNPSSLIKIINLIDEFKLPMDHLLYNSQNGLNVYLSKDCIFKQFSDYSDIENKVVDVKVCNNYLEAPKPNKKYHPDYVEE
jgi:GR25 family glycosyltransferase involved in LPS biosynthesis